MTKRFLLGIVLLVALVVPATLQLGVQAQADPLWFNDAWSYRRPVSISNGCGEEVTDYQVLVTLDSSSFDFTLPPGDGSDLRVTNGDGVTLIPFWIEEWDSAGAKLIGATAGLWPT